MKKLILVSALLIMLLAACGTSHNCDAYRKADYTKKL